MFLYGASQTKHVKTLNVFFILIENIYEYGIAQQKQLKEMVRKRKREKAKYPPKMSGLCFALQNSKMQGSDASCLSRMM